MINIPVTSSLSEVAASLQSKQNAGWSEQQQGYLFQTKSSKLRTRLNKQAHARLVNYDSASVTLV